MHACLMTLFLAASSLFSVSALRRFDTEKLVDSLHTLREFRGISKRELHSNDQKRIERKRRSYCPDGRRVRKEIRQLQDYEWREFVSAIVAIKQTGEFDRLARIHRGKQRLRKSHGGPNFLGWHRIYLLALEELLRRVEPCVTIPYWDSTMDYVLNNASWTVLFTEHFIGNGNGYVRTGPFNNWITGEGDRLTRHIASHGSLIKDETIKEIFTKTKHAEVTDFKQFRNTSIENMHGGVHSWVDGQMSVLSSATEDPVFFLLHSFVDCLWLWWTQENNIHNPYHDYPNVTGNDAPDNLMDPWALLEPLANITNREGYLPELIKFSCQARPTCSRARPSCGSKYLQCNTTTEKCYSVLGDWSKSGPPDFSERPPIRKGDRFMSSFFDPRTRNDPLPQLLGENDPDIPAKKETNSWRKVSTTRRKPKKVILL